MLVGEEVGGGEGVSVGFEVGLEVVGFGVGLEVGL